MEEVKQERLVGLLRPGREGEKKGEEVEKEAHWRSKEEAKVKKSRR